MRSRLATGIGVLAATATATAVLANATAAVGPPVRPGTAAALAGAASGGPGFLQVVAHEDDDILFMNPDMAREYSTPTVTVYLTAGEMSAPGFADPCAYAASREDGARAAHARMAGFPANAGRRIWDIRPVRLSTGQVVEVDTLLGTRRPNQVRLVFFRLHQSPDTGSNGLMSLDGLYTRGTGVNDSLGSVAADGSSRDCDAAVYGHQTYNHAQLVASLTAVMDRYQPTVVLAQDPKVYSLGNGDYRMDPTNFGDNSDHRGAARFAGAAAAAYRGPGGSGRVLLRDYRDYNIRARPQNLGYLSRDKQADFDAYMPYDPLLNSQDASWATYYGMFPTREYPRWSNGTAWAARDRKGRINAFAVVGGQAVVWRENAPGGSWTGPLGLGGGSLSPYLTVAVDRAGALHLFGIRLTDDQVVTRVQNPATGAWQSGWTALGNPNPEDPFLVGSPVVAPNHDGLLSVFVRNLHGGVSMLTESPDGRWPAAWADLHGGWVQDGLAATLAADGRIDLFAPTVTGKGGILHWRQTRPDGPFAPDPSFSSPDAAGPLAVGRNGGGGLELFYAEAGDGELVSQSSRAGGSWTGPTAMSSPLSLEGASVVTAPDGRMSLATRNGGAGVSLAWQPAPGRPFTWRDLGSVVVGAPTVVTDASGRVVVLALGTDARLHVARATSRTTGSPFGPWLQIGG